MDPTLLVGCPMWAHRPWVGRALPASTASGHELAAYSRYVNAVEGNTTFYALPAPATIERWSEQVHGDFQFVFKVPRRITHERRLVEVAAELNAFCDLLEPLHNHVGAVTLQLPASFAPVDLDVLEQAIVSLPTSWRWAVEVRHLGFFEGPARLALDNVLARRRVERVLLDSRTLFATAPTTESGREAWAKKPRVPALTEPLTDRPIVRFVGSDDAVATVEGLQQWQPIIADWLREGRAPTLFVHTPDNDASLELARTFHAELSLLIPDLLPLPEPMPVDTAEQATLF